MPSVGTTAGMLCACMCGCGRAGGGEDMDVRPQHAHAHVCVCVHTGAAWHACAHAVYKCAALVDTCTCKETCVPPAARWTSAGQSGWAPKEHPPGRACPSSHPGGLPLTPLAQTPVSGPRSRERKASHEGCQGGDAASPITSGASYLSTPPPGVLTLRVEAAKAASSPPRQPPGGAALGQLRPPRPLRSPTPPLILLRPDPRKNQRS